MDSQNYKNALYSFLGGGVFYIFQRYVKQSYQNSQKELDSINSQPVLQISQLQTLMNDSQNQDQSKSKQENFFVEGVIENLFENVQKDDESLLLRSTDRRRYIVYGSKDQYEVQLHIKSDGTFERVNKFISSSTNQIPSFQLKPQFEGEYSYSNIMSTETTTSRAIVQDFRSVKILSGLLNYSCKFQQFDLDNPQKTIVITKKKPSNDQEIAEALANGREQIKNTIFRIGSSTQESSITIGTRLVVYGKVVFDSSNKLIVFPAPLFFARNKEQILEVYQDQITEKKFLEVILLAAMVTCGFFFASFMKKALFSSKQDDQKKTPYSMN